MLMDDLPIENQEGTNNCQDDRLERDFRAKAR